MRAVPRLRDRAVTIGALYGAVVYAVMNYIVARRRLELEISIWTSLRVR